MRILNRWLGGVGLVMLASVAEAQVVDLSVNSNREIWQGQVGAAAGSWLGRGELSVGDTRRDLVVGAPDWSSQTGRLYVLFSGPVTSGTENLSAAPVILSGLAPGDRFGASGAAGYITQPEGALPTPRRDLVVGAPGASGGNGAAYLYYSSRFTEGVRLTAAEADLTIRGGPGDQLGYDIATGDLDGDGYREIILGAPGRNRIYVIRGGPSVSGTIDLNTVAPLMLITGPTGAGVGTRLAAGDLTGDLVYDLAIGAPDAGAGGVYIVRGRPTGALPATLSLASDADAFLSGIDTGDRAGDSLEIAPVDDDAAGDLIVGAPNGDGAGNGRLDSGEVYLVWGRASFGSGSLATANVVFYGAASGAHAGADVAVGDVNRLPSEDIAILSPDLGTAGEVAVILAKARSAFAAAIDLGTSADRRWLGDPAAGRIQRVLIYDHTGEGAEDIAAAIPSANSAAGLIYLSFSPAAARPATPAPGTTLTSTTVTFGWAGGSATRYWLSVGGVIGGTEYFDGSIGTATSYNISGLPADGRPVWVRIYSFIAGAWEFRDAQYTSVTGVAARILTPTVGSTLPGASATFTWDAGTAATSYWLDVSSARGGYEIYSQVGSSGRTATVSGLPTDGRTIWVRLHSYISGAYQFRDYSYTAATLSTPTAQQGQLTTPAPGSTLSSTTVTFSWTAGTGVEYFWLDVGTAPGDYSLYSRFQGSNVSATVPGLPNDGRRVWVRLWSRIGDAWQTRDYQFVSTGASGTPPAPGQITSPAPGSTLASTTVTFNWNAGSGVSYYWLDVGTAPGDYSLYSKYQSTNLSVTVSGLPNDGRRVWVRLWSRINDAWQTRDFEFVSVGGTSAPPAPAQLTSPAAGSTLAGTVTFAWNAGSAVSYYWLDVGTVRGGYDIYSGYQGTALSRTVSGITAGGAPVWVRLYSRINNAWQFIDYSFTPPANGPARITSPTAGSVVSGTSMTLQWSAGTGAEYYWLDVGTSQGGYDVYSKYQGTAQSAIVEGLPASGPIWVRIYSRINGAWQFTDVSYLR